MNLELTPEQLKEMKPGEVIAHGTMLDNPRGINMTNSGKMLRWVAKRGDGAPDWAVYCHWEYQTVEWIIQHGDKIQNLASVKRLVPCTEEALKLYRR